MLPFVGVALKACELMEIFDKNGQQVVMRFAKMYKPEKIGTIIEHAKTFVWWRANPKAAFMKAVGEINRKERGEPMAKPVVNAYQQKLKLPKKVVKKKKPEITDEMIEQDQEPLPWEEVVK